MINVDTVYQKVLVITNKEQRGYITPQEFNLLADKAQNEIFESYFHDMKTAYHKPKNYTGFSDDLEILSEKLQFFRVEDEASTFTALAGTNVLNLDSLNPRLYRLDTISKTTSEGTIEFCELNRKDIMYTENNPLTKATIKRPVYIREGTGLVKLLPDIEEEVSINVYYWRSPISPNWGYVVVNQKPLYNFNTSTQFELHSSEEEALVSRILELAGIMMEKPQLQQAGMIDKANALKTQND